MLAAMRNLGANAVAAIDRFKARSQARQRPELARLRFGERVLTTPKRTSVRTTPAAEQYALAHVGSG
jgi:hypothetical protein